ncbi:MAG: exodeoxyribonuclease VII small subunit [Acidobacteriota bacterium]|nr:exodeoxyribonuclease VII small subunit [Blastocatellia bacterium]MDW8412129.1 exodeoxyribonuclease VII small subunit [Acidobacteriota bacterium]
MLEKFEESLRELEQIVNELEKGNLKLHQALELFEKGVEIARRCQQQLEVVEQRVEFLIKDNGGTIQTPYVRNGADSS